MVTVLEYVLPLKDCVKAYFSLDLPIEAKILTVQEQNDEVRIRALVNPCGLKKPRHFRLVVTGQDIHEESQSLNYIGTFQDGNFHQHLFQII